MLDNTKNFKKRNVLQGISTLGTYSSRQIGLYLGIFRLCIVASRERDNSFLGKQIIYSESALVLEHEDTNFISIGSLLVASSATTDSPIFGNFKVSAYVRSTIFF
jgi:hypothetical protein